MPQKKWDTETDYNRAQDNTGFTNDGLGDHLGRHRIQRGYEYGSLTRLTVIWCERKTDLRSDDARGAEFQISHGQT